MNQSSPLIVLKGIGEKTEKNFQKAGIFTLGDLINYFPRAYDSFEEPVDPSALVDGQIQAVCGSVEKGLAVRHIKQFQIVTGKIRCERVGNTFGQPAETGSVAVTWFNMSYLRNTIKPGNRYVFRGRVKKKGQSFTLEQPAV